MDADFFGLGWIVNAIIFLAPLAFNLVLDEDPKVNRLEDSITLWRQVCENPLLAKTTLILFLNKVRRVLLILT